MKKTLGEVVHDYRKQKGYTLESLVLDIEGYDASNLSRFERGIQGISLDKLRLVAKALGVPVSKLYQESDAEGAFKGVHPADITALPTINHLEVGGGQDESYIPLLTRTAVSEGNVMHDILSEERGETIRIDSSILAGAGVEPQSAVALTMTDNNLCPVLPEGALIAINTSSTDIVNGKLFAINHAGSIRVATLYKVPGGGVRLKHYNESEYAEEVWTGEDAKRIIILGQVFWYAVTL